MGWLTIFDLKKHITIKNIQTLSSNIYSVAFLRDNQGAFICDLYGDIKLIKWKADAHSWDYFDFTEEPKRVGRPLTYSMCLTKDEKYLLVGSEGLVRVFVTKTREVTKEIKFTYYVKGISLIKDGKKAIIIAKNGNLSILDLETMEDS